MSKNRIDTERTLYSSSAVELKYIKKTAKNKKKSNYFKLFR